MLHASLLHGFNRYWLPLQKYYSELKVEDQPVKEEDYQPLLSDLKDHIESTNVAIQKIDKFEKKFEMRYPFGTFQDLGERHFEFIKYIEESSKPKEKLIEVPIKTEVISKVVKKVSKKEPTPQELIILLL